MLKTLLNSNSLHFSPLLPEFWFYILIAASCFVLILSLWRLRISIWPRLFLACLFILALLNPSIHQEQRIPVKNTVLIVVDQSASQNFDAREEQTQEALNDLKRSLEKISSLEMRIVSGPELKSSTTRTDLLAFAEQSFANITPARRAGVIFITDGQIHDTQNFINTDLNLEPLHFLISGKDHEKDRALKITSAPAFGIVGDKIQVKFKIEDHGYKNENNALINVKKSSQDIKTINAQPGEELSVDIPIIHAGQNVFEISTESLDNEITSLNNRVAIEIQGVRDRLRVLLVSGKPHAGGRTWRDLLKSDPGIDLIHFTILREPEKIDNTPSSEMSLIPFPFRELFEVKLHDFDLIVLDNYSLNTILPDQYFENIKNYVLKGGALLEVSGADYAGKNSLFKTALGDILPGVPNGNVHYTKFKPEITEAGKKHPVTNDLEIGFEKSSAWGSWFRQVSVNSDHSDVLMRGYNDEPLLLLKRIGEGRVAQITSDQIWLWSRGYEGGGPALNLLRRLIHWTMQEPTLDEKNLQISAQDYLIDIQQSAFANTQDKKLRVTFPDGSIQELELHEDNNQKMAAKINVNKDGIYEIFNPSTSETRFVIIGDPYAPEIQDVISTPKKVSELAKKTGGSVQRLHNTSFPNIKLLRNAKTYSGIGWIGFRDNQMFQTISATEKPLLPFWIWTIILISASILCWWREGRK